MVRVRTALLAEHVVIGNGGLPSAINIFDGQHAIQVPEGLVVAPYMIFIAIEASSEGGAQHEILLRLIDADGHEYGTVGPHPLTFAVKSDRTGMAAHYRHMFQNPHTIPGPGSYLWEIRLDGVRVGELGLIVHEPLSVRPQEASHGE
jgi:hypothetical protein